MKGAAANRRAPCVGLGKIKNTFGFTLCERTCSPTQGFVFMRRKAAMKREAKKRHHLDRRAAKIIDVAGADDELLKTPQVAEWLGVSVQWVELSRVNNYGPPFKRLGPKAIRYLRSDVRKWLESRTHHARLVGSVIVHAPKRKPAQGGCPEAGGLQSR